MNPGISLLLIGILCSFSAHGAFHLSSPYTAIRLQSMPVQRHRPLRAEHDSTQVLRASVDAKEIVKIFGRLAEKYIMLDSSGGMCCYSGCSDCEYRLPGGGYRMADQSSARPKWIPCYVTRSANGKEHTTKWSSHIFPDGASVRQEEFVQRVLALEYITPLGGPHVAASSATVEDETVVERLFQMLAEGNEKLTQLRMSTRLKQLADGEEGLSWSLFHKALGR